MEFSQKIERLLEMPAVQEHLARYEREAEEANRQRRDAILAQLATIRRDHDAAMAKVGPVAQKAEARMIEARDRLWAAQAVFGRAAAARQDAEFAGRHAIALLERELEKLCPREILALLDEIDRRHAKLVSGNLHTVVKPADESGNSWDRLLKVFSTGPSIAADMDALTRARQFAESLKFAPTDDLEGEVQKAIKSLPTGSPELVEV